MSVTFALVTALPCHAWPTPTHEHGSLMVISRIDRLFGLELKAAARELFPFLSELLWYLGTPIAWIWQLVRLILFVIVLLPFFLPPTIKYALSSRVHKGMRYGPSVRHAVDVYVPESAPADSATGTPVVIFVSGGAWIIGYRMWGFVMGLAMQQRGENPHVPMDVYIYGEPNAGDKWDQYLDTRLCEQQWARMATTAP